MTSFGSGLTDIHFTIPQRAEGWVDLGINDIAETYHISYINSVAVVVLVRSDILKATQQEAERVQCPCRLGCTRCGCTLSLPGEYD